MGTSFPGTVETFIPILLVHQTTTETGVKSKTLSTSIRALDLVHDMLVAIVFVTKLAQRRIGRVAGGTWWVVSRHK